MILPQTSSKLTEIIILKRDYFKVASSLELFANQMKSVLMVRFQCKMFHFLKLLSQFRFSDWTMHLCLQLLSSRSKAGSSRGPGAGPAGGRDVTSIWTWLLLA